MRRPLSVASEAGTFSRPRASALGYDRRVLIRFVFTGFIALMLTMALFGFSVELLGLQPEATELARRGLERSEMIPARYLAGGWALETAGLLALFLLVQGRSGAWWLDGLLAGWIAWIFRGPVLVLSVVTTTRLPREPWYSLSLRWLLLYSVCGLLLALLARRQGVRRETASPAA